MQGKWGMPGSTKQEEGMPESQKQTRVMSER